MPAVTLKYSLDLGACGTRECRVDADVLTDITGKLYLEIAGVYINVHGQDADLLPFISERAQAGMREALKHQYWSEMSHRVRDAVEA